MRFWTRLEQRSLSAARTPRAGAGGPRAAAGAGFDWQFIISTGAVVD